MNDIFKYDWFLNRNELGKYNFDKTFAIYDFSKITVSKILYGNKLNEIIKNPDKIVKELIDLNTIINPEKNINVALTNSKENEFYTDGKNISISGYPLLKLGKSGMDIILGALVHESSHIRFTDFNLKPELDKCIHWIWNIIEDEVIEQMLQMEKPGLGNVLSPIKDYMFQSSESPSDDDYDRILYTLFSLIRYPKNIENVPDEWLNKHIELFENIYKVLKKNNVLNIKIKTNCSEENLTAAKEIYKLICAENLNNKSNNKSSKSQNAKNLNDKFGKDGEIKQNILGDIKSTTIGKSTMESFSENQSNEIKNIIKTSENLSENVLEILSEKINKKEIENKHKSDSRGIMPSHFLEKMEWNNSNKQNYDKLKSKIKHLISFVKNIQIKQFDSQTIISKNEYLRNGSLVGRTLAQAYQGDKNVYSKMEQKIKREKCQKFSLALTLDESGSMSLDEITDLVSSLAILFNEAYRHNIYVNLYIYGHSDYIINYINPKTKDYYVLGDRFQGGGQNEVYAYNAIIKDILKYEPNSEILLLNITDSQYLANYSSIEKELKKWNKKIYQSLIVVNNKLTSRDVDLNNKIYGKNKWAHINNINSNNIYSEIKKLITHINNLAKKHKK